MTKIVFCVDFDETVLNTDRLRDELTNAISQLGGDTLTAAYLDAYEAVRSSHGVPRMPLILNAVAKSAEIEPSLHRQMADIFHSFPYQEYTYPGAAQLMQHLKQLGQVILFSDGDAFFQAHKIHSTSLATLVDSVVILPNKTDYFDELAGFWPADQYVFIDDKQKVLAAAKEYFGVKAMTVLVQQGRYATSVDFDLHDAAVATVSDVASLFPL